MKTVCVKKEVNTNENAVNDKKEETKYFVEQDTENTNIGDFEKKKIKQENASGSDHNDSEHRRINDRTVKRKIDDTNVSENSESDYCTDNEDKIDYRKRKYDTDEDYFPSDDSKSSTSSEEKASNEDEIDSTIDCAENEDHILAITENLSKINRKRRHESESIISEETSAELPLSCKFSQKMKNKYLDQYIQNILCEKEQPTVVDDEMINEENSNQLDEPCEERTPETVEGSSLQEETIERRDSEKNLSKNIDPHIRHERLENNGQKVFEKTTQSDEKKGNVKICKITNEESEKESDCMKNEVSINQIADETVDKPSINTLADKNYMYLKATKKFTNKKSSLDDYMDNILTENARNCEVAKINEPKNKTLNDYIENILMENAGSSTEAQIIEPEHDESLEVRKITVKVEKSSKENENDELDEEKENEDLASPSSPTEFAEHALQITEKVQKKRLCLDDYIENILFENAGTVESSVTSPPTGEWIESFSSENTMSKNVTDSLDENHPVEEMQKIYLKLENVENYVLENGDPEPGKIKQKTSLLYDNVTNEWWSDVYPNICADNTLQENISINLVSEDIGIEKNVKKVQVKLEKTSNDREVEITENLNNNELFEEKLKEKGSHLEDVLPEKVEEFQLNEELRDPLYLNEFVETTLQENSTSESSSEDTKQMQCTQLEKSNEDFLLSDNSRSIDLAEVSGRKEFDKKTSSLHEYMENILSENARTVENIGTTGLLTDLDALCEKQNVGSNFIPKTGIKLEKAPGGLEAIFLQEKLDCNDIEKTTENVKYQKLSNKSCKMKKIVSVFNAEENSPIEEKISLEDSFFPQRCYSCRTTFKNSLGLKEHIRTFHYNRKPSQKLGTHSAVKLKSTT